MADSGIPNEKRNSVTHSLFGSAGGQKSIERMLKRAAEKAGRDAKRRIEGIGRRNPFKNLGKTSASALQKAFERALEGSLKHHANNSGQKASIKMRAPDTGGRIFHFDHTAVSKATIALREGERATAKNTVGKREHARDKKHTSATGAHMAYIERDGAAEMAEASAELDRFALRDDGRERSLGGAQEYIEDAEKTSANARGTEAGEPAITNPLAFSFGNDEEETNIGRTKDERLAFWDLFEAHSKSDTYTLQHRLIVELPHECSAADRLAIMRNFTRKYEEDGVPFWVVLHAPTAKNDDRNFHAHIVMLPHPARKIDWPQGGSSDKRPDGPLVKTWDFAAAEETRDEHYNNRIRYPHRQATPTLDRDGKKIERHKFVVNERQRFAQVVNERMAASKTDVRYDHRTYKAMGIEVDAMKSISRIVTAKVKSGDRIVLDAGKTKRMIDQELSRLTRERAPELLEISRVKAAVRNGEKELRALERSGQFMRKKPLLAHAGLALKTALRKAALAYARAREAHVERKVKHALEVRSIERVIEATEPKRIGALRSELAQRLKDARRDGRDKEVKRLEAEMEAVPPAHMAKILRDAAKAELALVMGEQQRKTDLSFQRVKEALGRWTRHASGEAAPVLPEVVPTVTVAGIKAPQPDSALPEPVKRPAPPMFTGVESVIDQIFNTPQSQVMLKLYQRFGEYITDNAEPDVPGRTALDLAKNLVEAVKVHPLKAEQLMFEAKYGAAAPKVTGIGPDGEPVSAPVAPAPNPPQRPAPAIPVPGRPDPSLVRPADPVTPLVAPAAPDAGPIAEAMPQPAVPPAMVEPATPAEEPPMTLAEKERERRKLRRKVLVRRKMPERSF